MKKKGFTLIELLAVIIVLAIIALIATPTILNVVENSRKKAFEQTAIGYYNAAKYVYDEMYLNRNTQDVYFTFNNGEQVSSNENYQLKAKGDKPKGGLVYLTEEGSISVSIHNNKYCAMVEDDQKVRLSENIEECNFELTEVPESCYLMNAGVISYDKTNEACPKAIGLLIIPSEVNGEKVKTIAGQGFSSLVIKKVWIPNGVVSIGASAFVSSQLTNVNLPKSVKTITTNAFAGNQLTSINIPDGVSIGPLAFRHNQLTEITIPRNTTMLANLAFAENKIKKLVYLAENCSTYTVSPFSGNMIEEVVIGDNVTSIPANLFANQRLKHVTIPASVTTIGDNAFANNLFEDASAITIEGDTTRFDSNWTSIGFPAK